MAAPAHKLTPARARSILRRTRDDPEWYFLNVLGCDPWLDQVSIAEGIRDHDEVTIRSCHGAGKSWVAARVALWFGCAFRPSIVITTAPTDRQVRGILWKEIRLAYQASIRPLGGKLLQQELRWADDWWMWGFTAPDYDPERFQGFHESNVLVIVDEASGVSAQIYEAIDGILSSGNARLLLIGNPTNPVGPFAASHRPASGFLRFKISVFDTPNFRRFGITQEDIENDTWEEKIVDELPIPNLVTPSWVAKRFKRWGKDSPLYQARVLAEFPSQGSDTLIPLHYVEAACSRTLESGRPVLLGVDVARFGDDETVVGVCRGPVYRTLQVRAKQDTMRTSGEVIRCLEDTRAERANVDSIGIGAGVVDRLYELKKPVVGVNVGERAYDSRKFANLRAELFWNLRELFESGEIDLDPDDEELQAELTNIRYKVISNGKIQIESKEEMKKRGLKSPNRADACALAYGNVQSTRREFMIR